MLYACDVCWRVYNFDEGCGRSVRGYVLDLD